MPCMETITHLSFLINGPLLSPSQVAIFSSLHLLPCFLFFLNQTMGRGKIEIKRIENSTNRLSKMLEKYQQNSGRRLWDAKHENLSAEIDRVKKENDNMQIELRHLKGEDLNSLNPKELIPIEEALQNGLTNVRDKQMDYLKMLKKNESLLEQENKRLSYILQHHQQLAMNGNVREMELGYHHKDRDYPSQMSMAFRVQPIQPNLQEDKQ
ncbi:MADS box transcription factor domain-containing protein [Dioscorea alata]|uniref:MADS box transcription factor domain-containing protein n=1 Tax=Dioscorea alata TaxID=55571 RepID=A0ACB7WC52_DIOAL|nr:MADS box transcription factor domain-containing protein [Dioscorea alata]